jgi:hypothetical protein
MRAHCLLDEGVTRLGLHRDTTLLGDNVLRIPNHSGVMHNLGARLFFQKDGCQQPDDILSWHKLTCFIKEEAAIEVTIKCHAKVSPSALTTSAVAEWFSGKSGLGMPFGNVASGA